MKKMINWLRSHPARLYLAVFILMILPAVLLFPLALAGGTAGMIVLLFVIILANIAILLF